MLFLRLPLVQTIDDLDETIRNRLLGRNAAEAYRLDADARIAKIKCDAVQKMRDDGYLEGAGPTLRAPMASNAIYGPRTWQQVWKAVWSEPWSP